MVLHVRDPRQVTVAWVHHMRRYNDAEFRYFAPKYNPPLPPEFRTWEVPQQVDWAAHNYMPGKLQWLEDWVTALDSHPPIPVMVTKFEDFVEDQRSFFCRISDFFDVCEIRVPSMDKQSAAALHNFRRGSVDEWRDVLTPKQIRSCESRLEPLVRRFGWSSRGVRVKPLFLRQATSTPILRRRPHQTERCTPRITMGTASERLR
jgi:hypothetical protein